jgi:nucleoside-diphosphate-sugar epimerase
MYLKKKVLIIGGTGFFGKSIVDFFLKKKLSNNIEIIVFSKSAKKSKFKKKNNKNLFIKKISGNILNTKNLPKADIIIYCALLKNLDQDIKAVSNFISIAKKIYNDSKILYVSSGAVYGELPKNVKNVKENFSKIKDFKSNNYKNKYALTKIVNEKQFKKLAKLGFKVSIARCFSFVGEHLFGNPKYAIADFIKNILSKKSIYVKSNYPVIRSYLHADDLSIFLLKIANKSNINCPVYNCGSDNSVSLNRLSLLLSIKYDLKFISKEIKRTYLDQYVPNINKFRKDFKFYKKLSSYNAVVKTINQLKNKQY